MRPSPASHARTSDGTAPESEGSTRLPSFGDFSWGDAQCLPDSSKQIVQANPFAGVCSCLGATPADEADAPAEEAAPFDERPPSEPLDPTHGTPHALRWLRPCRQPPPFAPLI